MQIQRRFFQLDRAKVHLVKREGKTPQVCGYASVFYNAADPGTQYELWDDLVERIMPQCFNRALAEQQDCRALFNHDPNCLLGRSTAGTLALRVDETGLQYTIDPPDTQTGRDVVTSIERGDLSGSSFSFAIRSVTWRQQDQITIREIEDVDLYDVGPVTFPAYEAATTGLRGCRQRLEAAEVNEIKAELQRREQQAATRQRELDRVDVRLREVGRRVKR